MSSLRVLLVSYSFPPAGGVGVLRAASLARYLPSESIELDVLTARNASAVGADTRLLAEIPPEVTIHRTVTLDLPFKIKKRLKALIGHNSQGSGGRAAGNGAGAKPGLMKRLLGELMLPDPQITWLPILARAAKRIVKERQIDLVLITVPPFSSVLLVERLRRAFPKLAIVVDFRDEWLTSAMRLFGFNQSPRAQLTAKRAEAAAVRNATAVVAVTEAARREIRSRYPGEPENKFHVIPNGWDRSSLPATAPLPLGQREGQIVISHVGTVYKTTDPSLLVRALKGLPQQAKDSITLQFVGHIEEPRLRDELLQLGEMVKISGFVPQHEALSCISSSDYLLLVSHDTVNVGAKFYDYAGAERPMLGIVPTDSDIRRLLEEFRAGWWADSADEQGIRQLFLDALARRETIREEFAPDRARIAQYERKALAHRYAELLHSLANQEAPVKA